MYFFFFAINTQNILKHFSLQSFGVSVQLFQFCISCFKHNKITIIQVIKNLYFICVCVNFTHLTCPDIQWLKIENRYNK